MNQRPIMDAGPGINFFSINKERLLFSTVGPLSVPESLKDEILRKSAHDKRFAATERVWRKLPERLMNVLSDDATDELAAAVARISGIPFDQRIRSSRDLGETMVIAHAVVAAEAGAHVLVLMDDTEGCKQVAKESRRLQRLHEAKKTVGSVRLIHTLTVLERAAAGEYLPHKNSMRDLYRQLRTLDDGLPSLDATNLMTLPCWRVDQ